MDIKIVGKMKSEKRFKSFDYSKGVFVANLIHATYWDKRHLEHVKGLVNVMNKENERYLFKVEVKT